MKVGESMRAFAERLERKEDIALPELDTKFQEVYASERIQSGKEQLDALLRAIDDAGTRLQEKMTWQDLREYKRRIKAFLEMVVKDGFSMKEEFGYDRRGRTRLYKVLSEIDKHLSSVSASLIDSQTDPIGILASIAEIRGLLINLYL